MDNVLVWDCWQIAKGDMEKMSYLKFSHETHP